MFKKTDEFNQNIGNWNTSKVRNMSNMFDNSKKFNKNLSNWIQKQDHKIHKLSQFLV